MKLLLAVLAATVFGISAMAPAVAAEPNEMIAAPAATAAPSAHKTKKVVKAKKAKMHKARKVHKTRHG